MPAERWAQLDSLIAGARRESLTEARAVGQTLIELMETAEAHHGSEHWLDWEREKVLRLLRESHRAA
jgi:hypothetical protein